VRCFSFLEVCPARFFSAVCLFARQSDREKGVTPRMHCIIFTPDAFVKRQKIFSVFLFFLKKGLDKRFLRRYNTYKTDRQYMK